MESSVSTNLDSRPSQLKQQTLPSRKRRVVERSVVRVKMGENCGKVKNEGPPSDSWSWRKYGQKPIKGSPFPRGYYRCSTSKGCSAKKQVERCKTDASVLVITYTSTHNHPTQQNSKQSDQPLKSPKRTDTDEEEEEEDEEEQEPEEMQGQGYEEMRKEEDQAILEAASTREGEEHYFHYIESPLRSHSVQDMMINQDMMMSTLEFVLDEEPINMISCSIHHNMITSPKSEGNDFFDELEELPTALPFTSFTRSNCFQETTPPVQS